MTAGPLPAAVLRHWAARADVFAMLPAAVGGFAAFREALRPRVGHLAAAFLETLGRPDEPAPESLDDDEWSDRQTRNWAVGRLSGRPVGGGDEAWWPKTWWQRGAGVGVAENGTLAPLSLTRSLAYLTRSPTGRGLQSILYWVLRASGGLPHRFDRPDVYRTWVAGPAARFAGLVLDVFPYPAAVRKARPGYGGPDFIPFAHKTGTVTTMAKLAWDRRDYAAFPILADALEDAGCTRADVLDHLRGPGPHCRGCWVLNDLLDAVTVEWPKTARPAPPLPE